MLLINHGGPEMLHYGEAPDPTAEHGQPLVNRRPVTLCGRQSRTSDPPEWRPTWRIARGKAVFRVHLYCVTGWLREVSFLNRGLGLHFQPTPSKSLVG